MEEILTIKIGALVIVFILALTPGLLPLKLRYFILSRKMLSEETTSIILSCSLCCGAGVLMATIFLHILGEAREGLMGVGYDSLAELVMCFGFFLVYLVEELTFLWVISQYSEKKNKKDAAQLNQFRRTYSSHRLSVSRMMNNNSYGSSSTSFEAQDKSCSYPSNNNFSGKTNTACSLHATPENQAPGPPSGPPSQPSVPNTLCADVTNPALNPRQISLLRSMIVVAALSLHGALEGLALGLEDEIRNVWLLCLALSAHKIFIGFSIGMEMLEEGTSRFLYLFHISIFSLASPIGGAVGIVLVENLETQSDNGQIIIGVLQGISAGAILYVVFCEVLERERSKDNGKLLQFLSVVVGFAIIAILGTKGHSHQHSEVLGHDQEVHLFNDTNNHMQFLNESQLYNHSVSDHLEYQDSD